MVTLSFWMVDYVRGGAVFVDQPDLVKNGGYDHKMLVWDRRDGGQLALSMDYGAHMETVVVLPG